MSTASLDEILPWHEILRWLHVIPGFLGLAVMWIPLVAAKGGRVHLAAGRVFVVCAWIVGVSALVSCAWGMIDPAAFARFEGAPPETVERLSRMYRFLLSFLGFLAASLLSATYLGVRVIRTRRQPEQLDALVLVTALGLWAFAATRTLTTGFEWSLMVHIVLGGLGIMGAWDDWKFLKNPRPTPMAWWYKHMECMLGCCIGFVTAFLVFGANRFTRDYLTGPWQFLPWILPAAIGLPLTYAWIGYYRRRFGDQGTEGNATEKVGVVIE
jgi:hypothetical protein